MVRKPKIMRALHWLKTSNILYGDIHIEDGNITCDDSDNNDNNNDEDDDAIIIMMQIMMIILLPMKKMMNNNNNKVQLMGLPN